MTSDGVDEDRIRLDSVEFRGWGWASPDDLDDLLPLGLAERVRVALSAPRGGAPVELEDGRPSV